MDETRIVERNSQIGPHFGNLVFAFKAERFDLFGVEISASSSGSTIKCQFWSAQFRNYKCVPEKAIDARSSDTWWDFSVSKSILPMIRDPPLTIEFTKHKIPIKVFELNKRRKNEDQQPKLIVTRMLPREIGVKKSVRRINAGGKESQDSTQHKVASFSQHQATNSTLSKFSEHTKEHEEAYANKRENTTSAFEHLGHFAHGHNEPAAMHHTSPQVQNISTISDGHGERKNRYADSKREVTKLYQVSSYNRNLYAEVKPTQVQWDEVQTNKGRCLLFALGDIIEHPQHIWIKINAGKVNYECAITPAKGPSWSNHVWYIFSVPTTFFRSAQAFSITIMKRDCLLKTFKLRMIARSTILY